MIILTHRMNNPTQEISMPVKDGLHTCVEEWAGAQVLAVVHRVTQSTILTRLRLTWIH